MKQISPMRELPREHIETLSRAFMMVGRVYREQRKDVIDVPFEMLNAYAAAIAPILAAVPADDCEAVTQWFEGNLAEHVARLLRKVGAT